VSPDPGPLADRLARLIESRGPITVADYMAEANAHYYATRDPLGAQGDFITAPEISQMFGELIGLWLADLWTRAGKPAGVRYVELGPGRGTLAVDALRAMRSGGLEPAVELVETSPVLRAAQAQRLQGASWHDGAESLPRNAPLLVVANEFFDALPVRQRVRHGDGWRELRVNSMGGRFVRDEPGGPVFEDSPAGLATIRAIARRLARHSGAALIVDYGHERSAPGDTLQAVARHGYADPWEEPGERDLTAHVEFEALAAAARDSGVRVIGPVAQGQWLRAMGIELRAETLAKASPERKSEIEQACDRLVGTDQMGRLFKVIGLIAPGWPEPAGFQ
jgi:SAM-dependent MidA family methyltransferase